MMYWTKVRVAAVMIGAVAGMAGGIDRNLLGADQNKPGEEAPKAATPAVVLKVPEPGTWAAVPNSVLYPVMPPEAKTPGKSGGNPELWSPNSIMSGWSGGDVAQIKGVWGFIIWGGGHGDGPDNSLYWIPFDGSGPRALMGPFLAPVGSADPYGHASPAETYTGLSRNQKSGLQPNQAPRSRHTYSSVIALRDRNVFWASGGSITSGSGGGGAGTWMFDLAQTYDQAMARADMGWTLKANALEAWVARSSGYDEKKRVVVSRGGTYWGSYDPDKNTWTKIGDAWGGSDFCTSVAMDSEGRKMWLLGSRLGEVINLDTYEVTRFRWNTSGDGQPDAIKILPGYEWAKQIGNAPGVAWHPGRKRLLVWNGGQNLLSIDPVGNTVATLTMSRASLTPPAAAGTFGRFRLIPGTDTVAVVNAVDQSVYLGTLPVSSPEPAPVLKR